MHAAERALLHKIAHRLRRPGMAIGHVDAEQAVALPRGGKDALHFRRAAAEWLLAEDGNDALQRRNRLLCMKRTRGGDDQPVQVALQQRCQAVRRLRAGHQCAGFVQLLRGRIAQHGIQRLRLHERAHAMAADPPRAEEADAQGLVGQCISAGHSTGCLGHHGHISALTKLPGRSRVAFSASASCSSG